MKVPSVRAENVQSLRNLVKKVPAQLRDKARAERQAVIRMEKQSEGSSSYAISRGALNSNATLSEFVKKVQSTFFQRQPIGNIAVNKTVPKQKPLTKTQYVSAAMGEETIGKQLANDYIYKSMK